MTTDMLGQRVKRVEDQRLITGKGRYVDDIKLPGTLFGALPLILIKPALWQTLTFYFWNKLILLVLILVAVAVLAAFWWAWSPGPRRLAVGFPARSNLDTRDHAPSPRP